MLKRLISVCIIVILIFNICGCAQTAENTLAVGTETLETEYTETEGEDATDTGNAEKIAAEEEQTKAAQRQWQVYIQPDMPEPFIEVLKQYEDFMNADVQSVYDDDVCSKLNVTYDEWYLCYELCESLKSILELYAEDATAELEIYSYSLTDLTGDGFPELIMGRDSDFGTDNDYLYVVFYYSETEGIKMMDTTRYFDMSLYEGGIIEYISAGVDYTITYLRFQEETESWELADRIIVDWNSQDDSESYYRGVNTADFSDPDNEPMSEEEYREIVERYTAEPVELEWIPLFCGEESADSYFFPQEESSHTYMATFIDLELVEKEVVLYVTEVQAFEEGTLYELKIDSDMEARDTHAGYRGDWRNFGLFYVQGDEIYFIRAEVAQSEYQTVEEILDAATLVCSEDGKKDALGEDERGWHEFILAEGDRREYHGYSTMVETGYYEHFYWEKGKGLVTYESGYGALADGIEMYLMETP